MSELPTGDEREQIHQFVSQLVSLQHHLAKLLTQKFGWSASEDGANLSELPRFGTLDDTSTIWGFSQHGLGVRFVDIRTLAIVDMEDNVHDPNTFTRWRLVYFLESLGVNEMLIELARDPSGNALKAFADKDFPERTQFRSPANT